MRKTLNLSYLQAYLIERNRGFHQYRGSYQQYEEQFHQSVCIELCIFSRLRGVASCNLVVPTDKYLSICTRTYAYFTAIISFMGIHGTELIYSYFVPYCNQENVFRRLLISNFFSWTLHLKLNTASDQRKGLHEFLILWLHL